jgi:hypothetical protein
MNSFADKILTEIQAGKAKSPKRKAKSPKRSQRSKKRKSAVRGGMVKMVVPTLKAGK